KARRHVPQSALLYLCRRCLGLWEPENHLHSTVHFESRRQCDPSLLALASLRIQHAEPPVAVRLERAHTQFVGQGKGLLVGGFGLLGIRGGGVGLDDAKLVQRERLRAAVLLLLGQVERLARVLPGLGTVSRQTTALAEPRPEERT